MSIQREFPSYDDMKGFADLLAKLPGFTDSSWHNDTCPSMEHEQSQTRIWAEYLDPLSRENKGKRFAIERGERGDDCEILLETDNAAEVVAFFHPAKCENITPANSGASQLACNIVNNTFLSLDGFAAMRKQMEGTTYTAEQFGAELARITDRELNAYINTISFADDVVEIMSSKEWDSDTTQAIADSAERHSIELVKKLTVTCQQTHHVDCDDNDNDRFAFVGDQGTATWDDTTEQWSVVWPNGAWGFYTQEELDEHLNPPASSKPNTMRHITVYMSDGDTISTNINGTDEEIMRHYLGNRFEAGCDTKHHVALCIHFHDNDKRYGLRIKCIEHNGLSGCISHVRKDTVKIDDNNSYEEIMLVTRSDAEYALSDVWVYDMDGNWIEGIGYKHATT